MKSDNYININNRIARYITGNMTKTEKFWFELAIAFNAEMKSLVTEMKRDWNTTGEYFEEKNFNPNNAWQKLHQRLNQDELVETNISSATFTPKVYLRYAAVVFIALFASAVGTYKYYNPKQISLINNTNQNTIITTLPDGTTIYLAQNSTLNYPKRFVGSSRNVNLDGEAYFEVTKNAEKPFIIETKAASVKVLGTSFNLKSTNPENFVLSVIEGKVGVNLHNKNNQSIIAVAGDMVSAKNERLFKEKIASYATTKSTMVHLQFQDESLNNIINVINKTYGSNIQLLGDDLKNRKISVTFENDISSIVNILSVSFNLELKREPDSTIILKQKHD